MSDDLQRKIALLLDALPKESSKIAEFLKSEGLTGKRRKETACPLANYLSKTTMESLSVGISGVRYHASGPNIAYLPGAAQQFVSNFDRGYYPELEA